MDVVSYKGKTLIVSGIQDIIDTLLLDSEISELGELLKRYHERYIAEASEHGLEIEELEKEKSGLNDEITDLENEISELKSKIAKLKAA